jgi:hypothetical protein
MMLSRELLLLLLMEEIPSGLLWKPVTICH